jgi:hypothetical protein
MLGEHETEYDRGRLFIGEHQRREARARPEPVAAADTRLPVDRDPELVQGDRVAADRPLADAELARSLGAIDDEPVLQQLEEREESGRWT